MNCHETDSEIDEDIRERTFSPSFVSRPPQPVYVLDDRNVGMNRTNRKLKYSQAIPFILIVFVPARECYAVASLVLCSAYASHDSSMHGGMVEEEAIQS